MEAVTACIRRGIMLECSAHKDRDEYRQFETILSINKNTGKYEREAYVSFPVSAVGRSFFDSEEKESYNE